MIAAAHLDNFLFLIFFAVAILFQLLTRAASKTGRRGGRDQDKRSQSPPQVPRSTQRGIEESEEDRVRKFLEALGQPTSSNPPPQVTTRPTYQKPVVLPRVEVRRMVRQVLSPLPPLTTRPPEVSTEIQMPGQMTPTRERRVFKPKTELPAFEVQTGPPPLAPITEPELSAPSKPTSPVSKPETKLDVTTLLRSTSGLRNAIILREIFGPPRSLQPLDLVGNV